MHTAGPYPLRLLGGVAGDRRLGVAQSYVMHAVDGNLMFCDKVALNRFGQALRGLDAGSARCGRVRFHLQDVTFAAGEVGRKLIQLGFRVGGEHRAAAAELDLHIRSLLVLIEAVDRLVHMVHMTGGLLRGVVGVQRLLVG